MKFPPAIVDHTETSAAVQLARIASSKSESSCMRADVAAALGCDRSVPPQAPAETNTPPERLSDRVRRDVARLMTEGQCTHHRVAAALGLHPRALQRQLKKEGESFMSIKSSVQRDVALRYLQQPNAPLVRLTEILGYSETSALSRSCLRWFAASPRKLRKALPSD